MADAEGLQLDPLTQIVNVKWGTLYLYLRVNTGNFRGGSGPNPVEAVNKPSITVTIIAEGVKLLDQYRDPEANQSINGFSGCMQYEPVQQGVIGFGPQHMEGTLLWSDPILGTVGMGAQESYDYKISAHFSAFIQFSSPVDQTCPIKQSQWAVAGQSSWSATESREETYYVQLATVPINYFSGESNTIEYLYRVSAGNNIISVKVDGLIATSRGVQGAGTITAGIYSTAREEITKLSQLINYPGDESLKLDNDSKRRLSLSSDNQGTYKINVYQDMNTQQVDNYGKTFHPYKITFEPTSTSFEEIPAQPPQRLPLPSKPEPASLKLGTLDQKQVAPHTEVSSEAASDWTVQSINETSKTVTVQGANNTTAVLHSVTYHNSSTGETLTVPIRP
jgi:hypothetical protein